MSLTYKELRDNFMRRDEEAIHDIQRSNFYGTPPIEDRLYFAEQRLKDLTYVVMRLLENLDEQALKEKTHE